MGTARAKTEQDVKVAGLGITPETAVFTMRPPRKAEDGSPLGTGILCVAPASMNAQVHTARRSFFFFFFFRTSTRARI